MVAKNEFAEELDRKVIGGVEYGLQSSASLASDERHR